MFIGHTSSAICPSTCAVNKQTKMDTNRPIEDGIIQPCITAGRPFYCSYPLGALFRVAPPFG